ncbi:MAG: 3'(2'),5'-bisphosphate nucleotidase CysQ [Saprospiraceae bacterium]|nr:3'(2'),5'-bisphosphate nucleotidase CysQ [Saprospiraceae bacterium]
MIKLEESIERVVTIAIEAGNRIMDIYNNEEDFQVDAKADNSPLTIADREANEIICNGLNQLDPVWPIVSEENKSIPFEERKDFEYLWMVDPLDGTKEFIKRNGEFTVNIALIKNNRVIAGVVYAPALEECYYAIEGQGATKITNGQRTRLKANSYSNSEAGLGIVCSRSHLNEATASFIDAYNEPIKVSKGSSLKFLILASGGAHIYPRLAPTMEWDTAAAQIILEESGGKVLIAGTEDPVVYNKENLLNPHFIAKANHQD